MCEWKDGTVSDRISDWMSKWMSEWLSEWLDKRTKEQVNIVKALIKQKYAYILNMICLYPYTWSVNHKWIEVEFCYTVCFLLKQIWDSCFVLQTFRI